VRTNRSLPPSIGIMRSDARAQHRPASRTSWRRSRRRVSCWMSLTERMWNPNVDSGRHLFRNTCRGGVGKYCSVQRSWAIQQPSQRLLSGPKSFPHSQALMRHQNQRAGPNSNCYRRRRQRRIIAQIRPRRARRRISARPWDRAAWRLG
jgi:hypothetical protein